MPDGGYDEGYRACSCFWGTRPGSFVLKAAKVYGTLNGACALDVGCGEGKNAVFLADLGAHVTAIDISDAALANALRLWPENHRITWTRADVRSLDMSRPFDLVVAYGLLHCLRSEAEVAVVVSTLQALTRKGGLNVVCAFNDRSQDLRAHPGFSPCLLPHSAYVNFYRSWEIIAEADADLVETHPHNGIEHSHSLTRILARKNG
jgi:SAM-dependent methyltransferase